MGAKDWRPYVFAMFVSTAVVVACSDDHETILPRTGPEAVFARRLGGKAERLSPVPAPDGSTAYLFQTLVIEGAQSPNDVTQSLTTEAFFDRSLTQLVLRYDSKGPCKVLRPSSIPGGFEVDCTNDSSVLAVFQTDPALLEGLGLDDCNLAASEPRDVSDGCAAPTFQVSACVDQNVFALSEDGTKSQWGDQSQDLCARRTTDLEPGAFDRIPS